jgi:F-type H+-transporting ATPase subunit delta
MKNYLVAQRYADALAQALPDTADLERALSNLHEVAELLQTHHDFRSCLGNQAINVVSRAKVLDEVLRCLGAAEEVVRLMNALLVRDRVPLVHDTTDLLEEIIDERLERTTAVVTSAVALTDAHRERITKALSTYSGKAVRLECAVDPNLIGGVVARIEGRIIDGSLRTRLERLKTELIAQET